MPRDAIPTAQHQPPGEQSAPRKRADESATSEHMYTICKGCAQVKLNCSLTEWRYRNDNDLKWQIMDLVQFAKLVLGVKITAGRARGGDTLPRTMRTLFLLNSKLPESVLQTDLRFLPPDALYDLGPYHIFAEEAQCVSWWGFEEPRDDADCFVITNASPVQAFREDYRVGEVILAMVIQNVLSTGLLEHYRSGRFSARNLAALLGQVPVVGGFLNAKAIVVGGVACAMEVGEELLLGAASHSAEELASFFALVETTLGPELPD